MANDLQDLADWLAHRLAPHSQQAAGQAIANTVTGAAELVVPTAFDWLEGRVASVETMLFGTPQNANPPASVTTPVAPPATVVTSGGQVITPTVPTVPAPVVVPVTGPATDISSFSVDQLAAALAAKQAAPPPGDISTFSAAQLQAALAAKAPGG
jgi:hypothetical protein